MYKKIFHHRKPGFSLVEVLVSVMIISVLTLSIYSLIILSLKITNDNKHSVGATYIANQKMEYIRNLSYSEIGTELGWPHGAIKDTETINRDGIYKVDTSVEYVDDPFDGTSASSTDAVPKDYKNVTIKVSWNGGFGTKSISVFSKFIPPTEETLDGEGILLLTVVDANGNPVASATIHVYASTTGIHHEYATNAEGKFTYTFPPAYEGYEIIVSKDGYSEDRTYDRTIVNPKPTRPNLTIEADEKTTDSFTIDLMSVLKIYTVQANLPDNWQASNDPGLETQSNARLAFDNSGNVYIAWEDFRQNTKPELFAQKYDTTTSPPTKKWSGTDPDIRIRTAANQVSPDVKIDTAGNLYICWNDDSNGNQDAFLDKRLSATGGPDPAWGGELKIDNSAPNENQTNPRIAISDLGETMIYAVWQDNRNGNYDLFFQKYNSSKVAQLPPETNVNSNIGLDGSDQTLPNIVLDSKGDIYISWTDNRDGNYDIYGAKFSSSTKSRLWEKRLSNLGATDTFDQYFSDTVVSNDDEIYAVWTDERNGNQDIYAQKYDMNGNSQWAYDIKVNNSSSTAAQYSPAIAFDDNSDSLYVVWTDERNDNQDIYGQKLDKNGNSLWSNTDVRVSISTSTSNEYSPDITINPYNHLPYATWQSDINGNLDIFISPFDQYTITSYLDNVPLKIVGDKKIGEDPVIRKYDLSVTTNSSGFVLVPVEWDSVGYGVSLGGIYSTKSFIPDPPLPVSIEPDETKTLFLYIE